MSRREAEGLTRPQAGAFLLTERVGHGTQNDVMMPAPVGAALEVIHSEFGLQVAVLLLDGPAVMGQSNQLAQTSAGRQIAEVQLPNLGGSGRPFAEQPD